jgi:glycosyltransferase involved in cell wall biosynthesis
MRLIFWQSSLSPLNSSYIRALASRSGWDVTVIAERRMKPEREALGWAVPDFGQAHVVIASENPEALALQQYPKDTIHVVEGMRGFSMIRRVLPLLCKRSAHVGVVFESGDASGFKGCLRRILYTWQGLFHSAGIDFFLAMGSQGVGWYQRCLFPNSKIYPFGYVTAPDHGCCPEPMRIGTSDKVTVGFLGSLIPRKGGDLLIRALARLTDRNWRLVIVGDGGSRSSLEGLAVKEGIADYVTFTGVLPNAEAKKILRDLDLFVLPSRFDGWGAVVNEALMQGVPVVCSDRCGARDLLSDSWRGQVFKAGSMEGLREALATWISRGKRTPELTERIKTWSRCIEGASVADYFAQVLGHVYNGAPRPTAPWLCADSATARPVVLILLGSYLPGYKAGGPIRSIENLVAALGGEFKFKIVTLDRDQGDQAPFLDVVANRWVQVGQADVMYLRPGLRGVLDMCALLHSLDRETGLYINSFFASRFSILPVLMGWLKLCRPRYMVLAPRGEFSPGALRFKQPRKRLFIWISQLLGLHRYVIWQASSALEAADIHRQFPGANNVSIAKVIPGSKATSDLGQRHAKKRGELHAVFISRICPKKNLAGALKMLAGVSGKVFFDIFGPSEEKDYFAECQNAMAALPANIEARYCGQIEHAKIAGVFADHDLFLFPTFGENYGHVICEALQAGCPVLISDQTPWRNLEADGVGWDIPLHETERFRSVLQQCVNGDDKWQAELSMRARDYGVKHALTSQTIDANRQLFLGQLA